MKKASAGKASFGLAYGGLALLVVVLFGDVLFQNTRILSAPGTDLAQQFLGWREFGFSELRSGNLALWNPYVYGGAPYHAGFQPALLYPLNWLFMVLPRAAAFNWNIALHVFLYGALMLTWLRRRGLPPAICFFGGAVAALSGPFFLHIYAGHLPNLCTMAWAPLVFLAIDELFDRSAALESARPGVAPTGVGKAGRIAARRTDSKSVLLCGSGAVAMQVLAGHPQYVFYTAVAAGIYALARFFAMGFEVKRAALFVAIFAGGAVLSAAQLVPGFLANSETVRSLPQPYEFAAMFAFPPENVLTLFAPGMFGGFEHYWGRCYLWEMSLFCGITTLTFAVMGGCSKKTPTRMALLVGVGAAVLLALGKHTPLFTLLYEFVPGFAKFRGISKFAFPLSLFLIVLAAHGAAERENWRRAAKGAFIAAGVLAVLGLIAFVIDWRGVVNAVLRTAESYLNPAALDQDGWLSDRQANAAFSLLLAAVVAAVVGALLINKRTPLWGLLALGVAEVFVFARMSLATFIPSEVAPRQWSDFLAQHPGDERVLNALNPNNGVLLRRGDLWGNDPTALRRYVEFIAWTQGQDPDHATQNVQFTRLDPMLALLRLRYALVPEPNGLQIATTPTEPLPRLQLVGKYRLAESRDRVFETLRATGFDPRTEAVLETKPNPEPTTADGMARVLEEGTDHLTIEATVSAPSLLLVTDTWSRDWRVTAQSRSAQQSYEVLPADYTLRAIPLAAGHHVFRLEYAPRFFRAALWLSALAWTVFAACAVKLSCR